MSFWKRLFLFKKKFILCWRDRPDHPLGSRLWRFFSKLGQPLKGCRLDTIRRTNLIQIRRLTTVAPSCSTFSGHCHCHRSCGKALWFLVATFCDSLNNILRINCPLPPAAPILWTVQIQRQHRRSHLGSARTDIACELVLQESDCNFWAWMVQFLLLSLGIPYGLTKGH